MQTIDLDDILAKTLDAVPAEPASISRGRSPVALSFAVLRDLTVNDLMTLNEPPAQQSNSIRRVRASHHRVAQMLAAGARPAEVHVKTGYSRSRISVLQADPAFQELVEHYKQMVQEVYVDQVERMGLVLSDALEELHERIVENPETLTANNLIETIKTVADRTGHGATSKQEHSHIHLSSEDIAKLKGKVIEGEIGNAKQIEERTPQNIGTIESGDDSRIECSVQTTEAQGESCEGFDLREVCWEEVETVDGDGGADGGTAERPVV